MNLSDLESEALSAINAAESLSALDDLRVSYLGKKGAVTEQLKALGKATPEERQERGKNLNIFKNTLNQAIETRKSALEAETLNAQLAEETLDITLPARAEMRGSMHPISKVIQEVTDIFAPLGFDVAVGPEI